MLNRLVTRAREGGEAERGFYMVWFALTFIALTSFAGLALEYNRWQQIATRMQKAADAGALGGAVFLPDNLPSATSTAKAITKKNGFEDGKNGNVVTTAKGALPNQLIVTITTTTKNPWGAMVNYGRTTFSRSATAEYQLPQNLGSPQNSFGNDPESAAVQPQFWGNVFGPSSSKDKGDAVQSAGPNASATLCVVDNCPSSANADYSVNGYYFGIDVPSGTTGPLNVQVFDPAFVHVGDNCGASDSNANTSLTNAAALTAAQIPGYAAMSPTITPATRYAASGSRAYCSGDNYYGDASNTANPWTTWTLRAPDITTWDPTNNPIVCQTEFPGVFPEASNDQPNGTISSSRLSTLLQQSATYPGTNPARTFASFFRQWVTLCSVNSPVQGTYFLQVQTGKKIDGTNAPNGGGSNRFSIRVGSGSNYASSNGIHLYGNQTMSAYANATGANTQFYLTRVLPGEAGKTLILNFFDTGDASQAGTLAVLPPADSNVTGGAFASCQFTPPPGNATGPPWGTFSNTASGCKITNVSSSGSPSYNGQWVAWQIPIPANYTCDAVSATGCWAKLQFVYPNGTTVNDTTTWSAYILGEPVRIIK
jgi:hypothetical protein